MINAEFILPNSEEMLVQSIMSMDLAYLTKLGKAIERPTALVRVLASKEQDVEFLTNVLNDIRQSRDQLLAEQSSTSIDETTRERLGDEAYNYARLHDVILCFARAQERGQTDVVKRLSLAINMISDHLSQIKTV